MDDNGYPKYPWFKETTVIYSNSILRCSVCSCFCCLFLISNSQLRLPYYRVSPYYVQLCAVQLADSQIDSYILPPSCQQSRGFSLKVKQSCNSFTLLITIQETNSHPPKESRIRSTKFTFRASQRKCTQVECFCSKAWVWTNEEIIPQPKPYLSNLFKCIFLGYFSLAFQAIPLAVWWQQWGFNILFAW